MNGTFDFVRPLLDGRLLRCVCDGASRYIHISYSLQRDSSKWSPLTTCAEYSKYWLGSESKGFKETQESSNIYSILIKIRRGFYMHVGQEVFTFRSNEEICNYDSYEGGAKVPFAIGFGTDYIFFLTERMKCEYDEMCQYFGEIGPATTKEQVCEKDAGVLYRALYNMIQMKKYHVTMIDVMSSMI